MFIKTWRVGILCVIYILHLNVISGQRRNYPWHIFHNNNRRILNGAEAASTRPYMVWLRPDAECDHPNWLCGGAIIHEYFVLTSAACIEDVKRFYVVSGTYRWVPPTDNTDECVENGAVKAVWKCVPKSYHFDGKQFENIRWMMYDLAIVRVEEPFNFKKRVRGCDFIPAPIRYNNFNEDLEKPGTVGSTAGWGTTLSFSPRTKDKKTKDKEKKKEVEEEKKENEEEKKEDEEEKKEGEGEKTRRSGEEDTPKSTTDSGTTHTGNSPVLLETDVLLISKKKCKARWPVQHHAIIDQHMICAKSTNNKALGSMCMENDLNCKDIVYEEYEGEEEEDATAGAEKPDAEGEDKPATTAPETPEQETETENTRRFLKYEVDVHGPKHDFEDGRRSAKSGNKFGGFCENDHGGPLIVGRGKEAVVVGIITACMSKPRTHECYGPFLFTSIYRYKHLIACATEKVDGAQQTSHACRNALRSTKTNLKRVRFDWTSSKRVMSSEDFLHTNSSIPNKYDMPSNEAGSHENTRRRGKESFAPENDDALFNSSLDENAKATVPNRRNNPYKGVREITDEGKLVVPVPNDDLAINADAEEPKNWKMKRKLAREARARAALGLPVTNTDGGPITHRTKTTTEKYFPVNTYGVDSPGSFHNVYGDEPEPSRKRSHNV